MVKNKLRDIRLLEYKEDNRSEFARFIGVSIKTYTGWESGVSRPNLEVALEIAKKLNRCVDDIWYLED